MSSMWVIEQLGSLLHGKRTSFVLSGFLIQCWCYLAGVFWGKGTMLKKRQAYTFRLKYELSNFSNKMGLILGEQIMFSIIEEVIYYNLINKLKLCNNRNLISLQFRDVPYIWNTVKDKKENQMASGCPMVRRATSIPSAMPIIVATVSWLPSYRYTLISQIYMPNWI